MTDNMSAPPSSPNPMNPIVGALGGTNLAFTAEYPSCCGDTKYSFFNPATQTKDGQHQEVFHGILKTPSCCGAVELPVADTQNRSVCTPFIKTGCCPEWSIKDGEGNVCGYIRQPTCGQKMTSSCCPCMEAIILRIVDEKENQIFTLRTPKGSCECGCAACECFHLRCPHCRNCCQCNTPFHMNIPVYSGDENIKNPVGSITWSGTISGCTGKLKEGYICSVALPNGASYKDTCLLLLLAIYTDETLVGPLR